jgi:hypothetical protein
MPLSQFYRIDKNNELRSRVDLYHGEPLTFVNQSIDKYIILAVVY